MHPTADTPLVMNINRLGRRVMPGVMPPLQVSARMGAAFAPLRAAEVARYSRGAGAALFPRRPFALSWPGAGGGKSALRHNKRMHATADTTALKFLQRLGAARDAQR